MIKAGMNVARLNFSHGTHENHSLLIKNVRQASQQAEEPIAILADLQGPKIRVGILPEAGIKLKEGQMVTFSTAKANYGDEVYDEVIPVDYFELHQFVKKGERLLLDDGRIETKIVRVSGNSIHTEVINGGVLMSHKGINAPDSKLSVRALTDKDKEDAEFVVKEAVDFIALSFVTTAEDIMDLRYFIKDCEARLGLKPEQPIRIIAKIERKEAVKNIKEILQTADGIMIARGDLGVEMPPEKVPLVQKQLIDEALLAAKPVIVATQMLDSMQNNPRPTRAEVSDVANAVIDHTDAVMLSNETAIGKYPVQAVTTMADIIKETEKSIYDNLSDGKYYSKTKKVDEVVSEMSKLLAEAVDARLILAASISGETAHLISRHRPELPIVVATNSERVKNQLSLSWGVKPFVLGPCRMIEELIERSLAYLKKGKDVKLGDKIIVVSGEPVGQSGHVNLLEVRIVD